MVSAWQPDSWRASAHGGTLGGVCDEELLFGGNVSGGVVRVGDTVRRPTGPWTPAVHALLRHLHAVGFRGAPVPLDIDERGREVLTYAPGVVPWDERFHLLSPVDRLVRVARLIREFHDAVETFTPPPDAQWQVLTPSGSADLIAHHDLAPWNLVVGDQWVFIDWDMAAPGSRLWDLAYALHGFVPLSANPALQRATTRTGCGCSSTRTAWTTPNATASCRCWHGAPAPCTTSWLARRHAGSSRGRPTGARAMARYGVPTPTTSPNTNSGGRMRWMSTPRPDLLRPGLGSCATSRHPNLARFH